MHKIASFFTAVGLLAALLALNGCGVYGVAVEERTTGEWADDSKIALLIEKEFLADDLVKYMDFDAYCYRRHVYVVGEYESREQVAQAVKIAKAAEGVRQVTTYLLPKRKDDPGCGTLDTADLYQKVKSKLIGDKTIWSTNIDVEIVQCNVVLLGVVGSQKEKSAAEAHARSVKEVRGVKSFLTVK